MCSGNFIRGLNKNDLKSAQLGNYVIGTSQLLEDPHYDKEKCVAEATGLTIVLASSNLMALSRGNDSAQIGLQGP
jgi:hypothetical protein